jgi:hypothetical protein
MTTNLDSIKLINNDIFLIAQIYSKEKDKTKKDLLVKQMSYKLKQLDSLGQLDFHIFINPEFSEVLLKAREDFFQEKENMFQKIIPRTPGKEFSSVDKLEENFCNDSCLVVDKLYLTPKVFVHKFNNNVKIISDLGKNITCFFDSETIRDLVQEKRDYIIECNISFMKGKNPSTQIEILEDIIEDNKIHFTKATQVILNVIDCLYLGEDISKQNYSNRKKLLKTIQYNHHLKQAPFIVTNESSKLPKAVKMVSKLLWSSGAIITEETEIYKEGISNKTIRVWV